MFQDLSKFAANPDTNGYKQDGSQYSVLIVDDALAFRRLLKRVLEEVGYLVVGEVADGASAVARYSQLQPNVVTMDVTMPEMDGDQAVRAIMQNHPDANIVMVTSLGSKDLVRDCITNGAKGYILKPIIDRQIPKILETIKKAVEV